MLFVLFEKGNEASFEGSIQDRKPEGFPPCEEIKIPFKTLKACEMISLTIKNLVAAQSLFSLLQNI